MSSLWAHYKMEREGKSVFETDEGFIIYTIVPKDLVYIEDIYVVPKMRDKGLAQKLEERVLNEAKTLKCKKVYGSIDVNAKSATTSAKILFHAGYELDRVVGSVIYFKKDL